jgi:uncharacterized protein (UPF0332 family)
LKPETERYLDKARQALTEARAIVGIELAEAAGRAAYLAVFHAAQALIFERIGKVPKTHHGVHAQFSRLARNEPRIGIELRASCLAAAQRFIDRIVELLK